MGETKTGTRKLYTSFTQGPDMNIAFLLILVYISSVEISGIPWTGFRQSHAATGLSE